MSTFEKELGLKWIMRDKLPKVAIYHTARFMWLVVDFVYRIFTGGSSLIHGTKSEQKKSEEYEFSAQYVNIVYGDGLHSVLDSILPSHYIYKHVRYVHPRDILTDPSASLMGLGKRYAVFAVTNGIDVHDTHLCPFYFYAQLKYARHLYILRTDHFLQLADEIPSPSSKISIINMTARCGSTLLLQMFNSMRHVRAYSEPWAFNDLHTLYRTGDVSYAQYQHMLKACYKVLFADDPEGSITHMIAKVSPFATPQCPLIKEMFPDTAFYFLARDIQPNIRSGLKIIPHILQLSVILLRGPHAYSKNSIFPYDEAWWWWLWEKITNYEIQLPTYQAIGLPYGAYYYCAMKYQHIYEDVIMYEDLVDNPEGTLKAMCTTIGLSTEDVPLALQAMGSDSQHGLLGGRGAEDMVLTQAILDELDEGLKLARVPIRMHMSVEEIRRILKTGNLEETH